MVFMIFVWWLAKFGVCVTQPKSWKTLSDCVCYREALTKLLVLQMGCVKKKEQKPNGSMSWSVDAASLGSSSTTMCHHHHHHHHHDHHHHHHQHHHHHHQHHHHHHHHHHHRDHQVFVIIVSWMLFFLPFLPSSFFTHGVPQVPTDKARAFAFDIDWDAVHAPRLYGTSWLASRHGGYPRDPSFLASHGGVFWEGGKRWNLLLESVTTFFPVQRHERHIRCVERSFSTF